MKFWSLFIVLFGLLSNSYGQLGNEMEASGSFSQGFTAGFHLSSRGSGLEFLYTRGSGPTRMLLGLRGYGVKDKHEAKIESNFREQGSKFVYGKLNRFFVITPTFGIQKDLFPRNNNNFVSLSLTAQVGPALGILRPYYLDIFVPSPISPLVGTPVSQPYDPDVHTYNDIVGATSFFASKWELSLQPGVSFRTSAQIDFARKIAAVSVVEIGLNVDYFFSDVPIMAEINGLSNQQFFLAGTLGIVFGNRW